METGMEPNCKLKQKRWELKWRQVENELDTSGCKADTSSGGEQVDARTELKYWIIVDIKRISKAEASGNRE